jgi:hypothetical protein
MDLSAASTIRAAVWRGAAGSRGLKRINIIIAAQLVSPGVALAQHEPEQKALVPAIAPIPTPDHYIPTVGGRIQFRYYLNHRDDPLPEGAEDWTTGFQLRRTRVNVRGNVPADFSYFVDIDFDRRTGAASLLDVYGERKFGDGWFVRFGQFVIPMLRERGVPDSMQLAAERSLVNDVFEPGYSQGVMFGREWDDFRFSAAFTDGLRTIWTDIGSPQEADWALSGRGEFRIGGNWGRVRDFTSWRGEEFVALIGGAVHAQSGGDTFGTLDRDIFLYTGDVSLKGSGWNAFAAFIGRRTETPAARFDDFGLVAQGGIFVTEQTELFGRYDLVMPDGDRPFGSDFGTVTLGANHYIIPRSHALKFTGDVMLFLDRQSESASLLGPNTGQGLLASADRGQFVVRLQMQVVF